MQTISVDFSKKLGQMKPMHAVNNGPVYKFTEDQRITNIDAFREAEIPYARTHDASFCSSYGGEHTVDIIAIFPDFSKDPDDPASYDFTLTDEYMQVMDFAGVKPFYRLGNKIEHWKKKYGTLPPPDFKKWAVVCEHIIRHYTEGWADGFKYDVEYWEIWNEPDLDPDDSTHKRTWGGTKLQFFDLFEIAAKHLKSCFPHLKIGGPAICNPKGGWKDEFLAFCRDHNVPLDFFSWHVYAKLPSRVLEYEREVRAALDANGFTETESILNEWNYVKGWTGDNWVYSIRTMKNLKGAAFVASTIEASQYEPLDMLMYYDARPCTLNGMFSTDLVCDRLKGYYPFRMFNQVYRCGTAAEIKSDDPTVYGVAAVGKRNAAVMFTYYEDLDEAENKRVKLELKDLPGTPVKMTLRVLDEDHDDEPVREEIFTGKSATVYLDLALFTTCLVTLEPAD